MRPHWLGRARSWLWRTCVTAAAGIHSYTDPSGRRPLRLGVALQRRLRLRNPASLTGAPCEEPLEAGLCAARGPFTAPGRQGASHEVRFPFSVHWPSCVCPQVPSRGRSRFDLGDSSSQAAGPRGFSHAVCLAVAVLADLAGLYRWPNFCRGLGSRCRGSSHSSCLPWLCAMFRARLLGSRSTWPESHANAFGLEIVRPATLMGFGGPSQP